MSRTVAALLAFAVMSVVTATAHADPIPAYFFKEWSISRDCSEQHAGPAGHVQTGLRFRVARSSLRSDDASYALEVIDQSQKSWPGNWKKVRLEFRDGSTMAALPADFECLPGEETSNPFLAMSNYSQTAEPWYEFEHWYGILLIHGEPHHLLIFPRNVQGESSAVIVLQDVDSGGTIKLDHNGTIHSEN
jgi:hypothetical protein